jgi:hypothetical protein
MRRWDSDYRSPGSVTVVVTVWVSVTVSVTSRLGLGLGDGPEPVGFEGLCRIGVGLAAHDLGVVEEVRKPFN